MVPITPTQSSVIEISFVDLQPNVADPAAIELEDKLPKADMVEANQPREPDPPSPSLELSGPVAPAGGEPDPEVLVQLEREQGQIETAKTGGDQTADTVGSAEVAAVLRRLSCQRLTRKPNEDCPKSDPFADADARTIRESSAHNPRPLSFDIHMNAAEAFSAKQKQARHMFPGMDADMFVDTLPPGAYQADRIRNGQEPLWNEDMRRGFRSDE